MRGHRGRLICQRLHRKSRLLLLYKADLTRNIGCRAGETDAINFTAARRRIRRTLMQSALPLEAAATCNMLGFQYFRSSLRLYVLQMQEDAEKTNRTLVTKHPGDIGT